MMQQEIIPIYICIPFILFLLLIAIMPLAFGKFWDKNRNKGIIGAIVSIPVLIFLLGNFPEQLLHSMEEYLSFIALLGSLFIISGGILLTGDLQATPKVNTLFFLIGGIIANLIGTTGASMLLIRPLLRTNSERKFTGHIPVFFIFIVSNIGGCLTPIGDPPLFLGYLKGVPFIWTLKLFPIWIVTMGLVLAVFYIWDTIKYKQERPAEIKRDLTHIRPLKMHGGINFLFLLGVVLAVALQTPAPYREIIMAIMTALSLLFTKAKLRHDNKFTYHPIIEVAVLFIAIFVTMVPILILLREEGARFGITEPWQYFWLTGGLSSFLDNAPTYVTFFSLAESVTKAAIVPNIGIIAGVRADLLMAISAGAVFMGAMTYIGNGPNFMVKSIAEQQKVKIPHFFGYMVYSGAVLLPIFILVTFLFYR
jgi:Na+/H+ antiporter NhaD/arsenite permease-like protein